MALKSIGLSISHGGAGPRPLAPAETDAFQLGLLLLAGLERDDLDDLFQGTQEVLDFLWWDNI